MPLDESWRRLAALPLRVEGARLEPLELTTASGWTRRSTVVHLHGIGHAGRGEDVTYSSDEQLVFQLLPVDAMLRDCGSSRAGTLGAWCDAAATEDWFPVEPEQPVSRLYRRWAFESAALDLALRQNDVVLADLFEREAQPVRFAVSTGLGSPPTTDLLRALLTAFPETRFKLDWAPDWDAALLAALGAAGRVDVVDLKGLYSGAFSGPPPDAEAYRALAEALPRAWLEDPAWTEDTAAALAPHRARVTWDVPLHCRADFDALPFPPQCVNLKPSRCSSLRELLDVYALCETRGIEVYGGGQFELGPGRLQAQHLASLFHADAPNDLSPTAFHAGVPPRGTPDGVLAPPALTPGLGPEPAA